jgi:hypothetical protein
MKRDEDADQRLARIRKEAWEAVENAYVFGEANSYTHESMRAVLALDRELDNFVLVPRQHTKPRASESDLRAALAIGRPN